MPGPELSFLDVTPLAAMPGMRWPTLPRLEGLVALGLLHQLERSQWWGADDLHAHQLEQLQALVDHARRTTSWYGPRLPDGPLDEQTWRQIPILRRETLQEREAELRSKEVPREHGALEQLTTSGSSGRRVRVHRTRLCQHLWQALTLRDHAWHQRDLGAKLGVVRHPFRQGLGEPPDGTPSTGWGPATSGLFRTGSSNLLSVHADIETQAQWLLGERPDYLLIFPSALRGLAQWFQARDRTPPALREVRTISEALDDETRALSQEVFGCPIVDTYSTQEVGYVALQCPEHDHYHVQSETCRVEILGEDGSPCAPGELGRVILTPLHNFATILLRYDVGDYAEVGEPCPCGRGLPVIRRIAGRVRNLMVLPDGRRIWPRVNPTRYGEIAPITQFQIVQKSLDHLEARFVVSRPLTQNEEEAVRAALQEVQPVPFHITLRYLDAIPRSPGGKYEDFLCEIDA